MKTTNSVTAARRAAASRKASVFSNAHVSTFGMALFIFDVAIWIIAFNR